MYGRIVHLHLPPFLPNERSSKWWDRGRRIPSAIGGLGKLPALNCGTPVQLKKDIARLRTLTNKPFGVNLTILPAMVPPNYEGFAQVIIDSGVKIVETAGNNPKKWVV